MTYRIWFDLQPVQTPHEPERGIPRYTVEVAAALQRAGAPVAAFGMNPHLPSGVRLPASLARSPLLQHTSARSFHEAAADSPLVYHVPSPFESIEPRESLIPPYVVAPHALAVTIHDLIPFVFPDRYQASAEARQFFAARAEAVRQADLLVTVSEHSRRDLVDLLDVDPGRCVVTGGGVSEWFSPPLPDEDPGSLLRHALPAIERPFVLGVGGAEWRKNNETLIAAYAALPDDLRRRLQLVVVARQTAASVEWFDEELRRQGLRLGDDVVITGVISDEVLRALYRATSLFVFPSRYEGFGLPALEAARCGAVPIVADNSSLPEVLECPEATFPAEDADALAQLMVTALQDDGFRARVLTAGAAAAQRHTWDHTAERLLDAYGSLPWSATQHRSGPRRRFAVVAPFRGPHPLRDRAAALVSALAEDATIDCFADGRGEIEPVSGASRTLPVATLGRTCDRNGYDAVICLLANDPELLETRDVVFGGTTVLWLVDPSYELLALGVVPSVAADDHAALVLAGELTRAYGSSWPTVVDGGDPRDPATYRRAGLPFLGDLARHADVVVAPPDAAGRIAAELHLLSATGLVRVVTSQSAQEVAATVRALWAAG